MTTPTSPFNPITPCAPVDGRRRLALQALLAALPLTAVGAVGAQTRPATAANPADNITDSSTPGYSNGPASADGIGKRYMGRELAAVMGWQGAAWLEREERQREERTDLLLQALALKPGMVVGDIGAGTGYLSRRMAAAVAPGGKVLAQDVQPEMIAMLRKLAQQQGLRNIEPVLGSETDVRLPAQSLDLAIMVDVYHELAFPREVLASIVAALKVGGRLVFVEYRAEDAAVPIKPLHKMSQAQVRREAEVLPLAWQRTIDTLPWQHIVVFQRSR